MVFFVCLFLPNNIHVLLRCVECIIGMEVSLLGSFCPEPSTCVHYRPGARLSSGVIVMDLCVFNEELYLNSVERAVLMLAHKTLTFNGPIRLGTMTNEQLK